jgi:hypothetical protein
MTYDSNKRINELDTGVVTDETKFVIANNGKALYQTRENLGLISDEQLTEALSDYMTESEINTLLESYPTDTELATVLLNYYTQSQVNTLLSGKANTVHTHTASQVTDFNTAVSANSDVSANTTARHTHSNKALLDTYTQTESNLALAVAHKDLTNNPHSVTKSQVGLGNVDNTSDLSKPISTATQTALNAKVTGNTAITGATKTKVTYDAKGLVTDGADATTADISDSTNRRYVTDAQLTVIGNTSNTNTGDVTVTDSSEIDFTLTGQDITASLKAGSIDESKLDASTNASLDLADSSVQPADSVTTLNMNTARILGRTTASSGAVEEITIGSGLTLSAGQLSATGGGGGEVNTASNVGTAGVGVFKQKTGVDLEFKKINAGSNKISITDDTTNSEVDIDVNPANINTSALNNDAGYTTNTGTVTSVAVSGSDGIEIDSGSPVTTNGTIALGINKTTLLTHINVEDGAEVNNISDANATDLTDGGDTTLHTHDSRYYTESEVDTLLSGKENSLGFTPENSANKENSTLDNSTTKYPTVNLLQQKTLGTIEFTLHNNDAVITTSAISELLRASYSGTITKWTIDADATGDIVIDVLKNGSTITASAKPTLSSASTASSSTLTGWTTTFTREDTFKIVVDSASTVKYITLTLYVTRT